MQVTIQMCSTILHNIGAEYDDHVVGTYSLLISVSSAYMPDAATAAMKGINLKKEFVTHFQISNTTAICHMKSAFSARLMKKQIFPSRAL